MSKIALELINKCLETRNKQLDLGHCGLTDDDFFPGTAVDIALRKCHHLTTLILSDVIFDYDKGRWHSSRKGESNYLTEGPAAINELQRLEYLECACNQGQNWEINDTSFVSQLVNLRYLNLRGNEINDLKGLKKLSTLEHLNLIDNRVSHLKDIEHLQELQILDLTRNRFFDLSGIEKLSKLIQVSLVGNNVVNLAPLENLTNLISLDIQGNEISNIKSLRKLTSLHDLSLNHNPISQLQDLELLHNLKYLWFTGCKISSLKGLENLAMLEYLDANDNRITSLKGLEKLFNLKYVHVNRNYVTSVKSLYKLPLLEVLDISETLITSLKGFEQLKRLKILDVSENKIKDISGIESLNNLERLDLSFTEIESIPNFQNLTQLKSLFLRGNKLSTINGIEALKDLMELDLSKNKIRDLSPLRPFLERSKNPLVFEVERGHNNRGKIAVGENPLENPPLSTVRLGNENILRHFDKIKAEGIDYLYEAKLTLVGDGAAGKTSLQKRLIDPKALLPMNDTRTRGIEVVDWRYKGAKNNLHIAHIWDFGGQDVYYPVHRFFLTENSVFVLIASTRQANNHFDYWIPTISQFGDTSPIVLGQTCHEGNRMPWNDLSHYLTNPLYNIIKTGLHPYTELNLPNNNEGLAEIKKIIIDQIQKLPHYGKGVPKSWVKAREAIAVESSKTACISFEEFINICSKTDPERMSSEKEIIDFGKFLHDQGIILWYSGIDELKSWVILQPEWAMNAVYKIIDDDKIQKRYGHIISSDFDRIWNEKQYKHRFEILKKLLQVFKIAFPKKHNNKDFIIAVRLLSMPKEVQWKIGLNYLQLIYEFKFMPKGLVNQLSADLSRYIKSDEEVWNDGVYFRHPDTGAEAQIIEDGYNRTVDVKTTGKDARGLIMMIRSAIQNVIESYKGLKPSIYVPCKCEECINTNNPEKWEYQKLLNWSENQRDDLTCNASNAKLSINSLLYNVGLTSRENEKIDMGRKGLKKLKAFISYSKYDGVNGGKTNYLNKFKECLVTFRNFENRIVTWDDTQLVPGEEWSDRIREELKTSDIIFLLISPSFLNTKYIVETELKIALERHEKGECIIVPLVIRPCAWTEIPILSKLNGIPHKGKPVASWRNKDEAWLHVFNEVKKLLLDFDN